MKARLYTILVFFQLACAASFAAHPSEILSVKNTRLAPIFSIDVPDAGYTGLVNSDFSQPGFGLITFRTGEGDRAIGKILVDGLAIPFRADFFESPTNATLSTNLTAKRGKTTLNLTLNLTLQADTIHFTGTLSGLGPTAYAISGERNSAGSNTLPVPHSGKYNALMDGSVVKSVRGFTLVTVKPNGTVTMSGTLPDGTKFTSGSRVSMLGRLDFATGLYKKEQLKTTGYVTGTLALNSTSSPKSLSGNGRWNKPANNGSIYPTGVAKAALSIGGALYLPPQKGERVVTDFDPTGNATFTLSEGNLPSPVPKAITIDTSNKVTVGTPGADKLAVTINPALGTFQGSFIHSDGKRRALTGLFVPGAPGRAEGLFVGTDEGGVAIITP